MNKDILNKIEEIKAGSTRNPEVRKAKYDIIMKLKADGLTNKDIGVYFDCGAKSIKNFIYNYKNADKIKEYKKKYDAENADKIKEYKKKYYAENADKIKEYRLKNADKIKEYKKEYYAENKDKCNVSNKWSKYKRLVKIANNYNYLEELDESDKKFIINRRDCGRLIETNFEYGKLKPAPVGYERHHIIPYLTCIHYWELTGDNYYLELTWKDENIIQLTPEDHSKLHSKLYEFGYGREAIVLKEKWNEYRELVINLIENKNQSCLDDF